MSYSNFTLEDFKKLNVNELLNHSFTLDANGRVCFRFTGEQGVRGTSFLVGILPPTEGQGINGDVFLDTETYLLYSKTDGEWGEGVSIVPRTTENLKTTGQDVNISNSIPPTVGQALIAISPTSAVWQTIYTAHSTEYTVTNKEVTRVFDANNITLHHLADIVGTIIQDMRVFKGTSNSTIGGNIFVVGIGQFLTDGINDEEQIQLAIDNCEMLGGGIVYFQPGTYNITNDITLKSNVNLVGLGSVEIKKASGTGYIFLSTISQTLENVTIQNIVLNGNNLANVSLIQIHKFHNIFFKNIEAKNVNGIWGMLFGYKATTESYTVNRSYNLEVDNIYFNGGNTGTYEGLLVMNTEQVSINNVTESNFSGMSLISSYIYNTSVSIRNIHIKTSSNFQVLDVTGNHKFSIHDVNLVGSHPTGRVGIIIRNSTEGNIDHCSLEYSLDSECNGLQIMDWQSSIDGHSLPSWSWSSHITIQNSKITNSYGIVVRRDNTSDKENNQDHISIVGNTILQPRNAGIKFGDETHPVGGDLEHIKVVRNIILGRTGTDYCLAMLGLSGAKFKNITVSNNTLIGTGGDTSAIKINYAEGGNIDNNNCISTGTGSDYDITNSTGITYTYGNNTGDQDLSGLMVKSNNLSDLTNTGTARTNLDVHSKSEVVTLIDSATVGLLDDRGGFDASVNTFPTTGGSGIAGAIKKGDLWFISTGGTLGGQVVTVGDSVRALVDTPGQTSSNWNIIEVNINYVPENQANKVTNVDSNKTSNVFFASVKAIYDWATGLFYTKSEVNTLATNYYTKTALDGGQLDSRYYTESEVNSLAGNYALKTGATFTGAISAINLINTNTGDQTITSGSVTATAGQTVFTTPTYVIGNNQLMVFVNGFLQEKTTHYTETSTASITFGTGLDVGSIVTYRILS